MVPSYSFLNILDPHVFAENTGHTFRGLSITEKSAGWNVVLRSFGPDGGAYYAIGQSESPLDALERLYEALGKRGGARLWRLDKFFQLGGE